MKMFRLSILILLTIVITTGSLIAQTPKILWSPDFVEAKGDKVGNILHDDGQNVYIFVYMLLKGRKTMTPGIIKMDAGMNPVMRKDYSVDAPEKTEVFMLGMFYCGGKFIMLTYIKDTKTKGKTVYATTIDPVTLEPVTSSKEIWKLITKQTYAEGTLNYIVSNDSAHFMIAADDYITNKFCIFNSDLKIINEQSDVIPYSNPEIELVHYFQANDATIYCIAKHFKVKRGREIAKGKEAKADYTVEIFKYSPGKDKEQYSMEIKEGLLDNIYGAVDPATKDLIVFATYTDVNDEAKWLYNYDFIRINSQSGAIVTRTNHKFSAELISQLKLMEPDFRLKKEELVIPKTFNIFDIKVTADGRIYFVLERDYYFDNNRWTQGLITFLHDAEGNQKWFNYIPKNQTFTGPNSFAHPALYIHKDKLVVFYNEHSNIAKSDPVENQSPSRMYNGRHDNTLMKVEIDNSGKATRQIFSSSVQLGTPVLTTHSVRGFNNRFLLYGSDLLKNSYKIGVYEVE